MDNLFTRLSSIDLANQTDKHELVETVVNDAKSEGYEVVEINETKPWGAYIRFSGDDADRFVETFFPDLSPEEARLGIADAELSPKILIVSPKQRLSWQFHDRRAERWHFLTSGAYYKSVHDEQGDLQYAATGTIVQFQKGERHRLVGLDNGFTMVAEIWQHTDAEYPSDEDDIVRLEDDYSR